MAIKPKLFVVDAGTTQFAVRAKSSASALNFIATKYMTARQLTADEAFDLAKRGVEIEDASAAPSDEAAAGQENPAGAVAQG